MSIFKIFSQFSLVPSARSSSTSAYARFLSGESHVMPKASSIFSGKFALDKDSFRSTQNLGRPGSFAEKRRTNPFVWKSFSSNNKNANKAMDKAASNGNITTTRQTPTTPKTPSDQQVLLTFLRRFNSLAYRNQSTCQYEDLSSLDEAAQLYINSTTNNCFCQTIYYILNTLSSDTQLLFSQVSPMLLGKILYAPNTPAYTRLIKRVNATFENADTLLQYIGRVADASKYALHMLDANKTQLAQLNTAIQTLIQIQNLNSARYIIAA